MISQLPFRCLATVLVAALAAAVCRADDEPVPGSITAVRSAPSAPPFVAATRNRTSSWLGRRTVTCSAPEASFTLVASRSRAVAVAVERMAAESSVAAVIQCARTFASERSRAFSMAKPAVAASAASSCSSSSLNPSS